MPQTLFDFVVAFLKERSPDRFTSKQIAEGLLSEYPDRFVKKTLDQLTREISSNYANKVRGAGAPLPPEFRATVERPRSFYWEESTSAEDSDGTEAVSPREDVAPTPDEHVLYRPLIDYLETVFGGRFERIDEGTSKNRRGRGGNRWLHPDIAGFELLSTDWDGEVLNVAKHMHGQMVRFWSLEVKRELTQSDVRECYFQAVANSSWANIGYLAAAKLDDPKVEEELRLLSQLHGIGVIRINVEDPADSQIFIPARERPQADLDGINRLAKENRDFKEFISAAWRSIAANAIQPKLKKKEK